MREAPSDCAATLRPPMPSQPSSRSGRRTVFSTAHGTQLGPFGLVEWSLFGGIALMWGSSYLFIDISLDALSPLAVTWLRVMFGLGVLAAFPVARRPVDRADWRRLLVLAMTWNTIPFILFPVAQRHIDSSLAGMLNAPIPIYSAVIAVVLLRRIPRVHQIAGISLGLLGAIGIGLPAVGNSTASSFGVLLVVVATLLYGLSINLAVPLQQRYGAPAVIMRALAVSAVVTMPLGVVGLAGSDWHTPSAVAVAVLGIMNTGIAYVTMASLVGRVGPTRGSVAVYCLPAVAMVLGVVFRDEIILPIQIAGTALVLLGAWLTSHREF